MSERRRLFYWYILQKTGPSHYYCAQRAAHDQFAVRQNVTTIPYIRRLNSGEECLIVKSLVCQLYSRALRDSNLSTVKTASTFSILSILTILLCSLHMNSSLLRSCSLHILGGLDSKSIATGQKMIRIFIVSGITLTFSRQDRCFSQV